MNSSDLRTSIIAALGCLTVFATVGLVVAARFLAGLPDNSGRLPAAPSIFSFTDALTFFLAILGLMIALCDGAKMISQIRSNRIVPSRKCFARGEAE